MISLWQVKNVAFYGKVLQDLIEGEKQGKHFPYSPKDRVILDEMFREINGFAGTDFHYLAELDAFTIQGAGPIIARYIWKLETHAARAFLIPQMVSDRIKDCDRLVLDLYRDFRRSPNRSGAAYVRYDNAFWKLKPKRLKQELLELVENPMDAYWLPLTVRTIASWKLPEMYPILLRYADSDNIIPEQLGCSADMRKQVNTMKRDLKFCAIAGLKYYPTLEAEQIMLGFLQSPDKDIAMAARKTWKAWEKKRL